MESILISIRPKWVAKILNGEKTVEIRKTCPQLFKHLKPYEGCSIDVYIYCTKDNKDYLYYDKDFGNYITLSQDFGKLNGKVVAKFTLNKVEEINVEYFDTFNGLFLNNLLQKSCLTIKQIDDYLGNKSGYAWHISNLVIFDEPKELNEFSIKRPHKHLLVFDRRKEKYRKLMVTEPLTKAPQSWCYMQYVEV